MIQTFLKKKIFQIGSFLLEYAFLHPDLVPFVITQLAGVLATLTLLGWADIDQYKNVYKDILQFIQVKAKKLLGQ